MSTLSPTQVFVCPKCQALYTKEDGSCQHCGKTKFRNTKVTVEGVTYDSGVEYRRFQELKYQERMGEVTNIIHHPTPFDIVVAGIYIGRYTPDFKYYDVKIQTDVFEDVKSKATRREAAYRLRKKLVEAIYAVSIREILY